MAEDSRIYHLTMEQLNQIAQAAVKTGIDAYRRQEAENRRKDARANDPVRIIKEKLSGYRRVKKTLKEEAVYTPEEQREYRLKFLEDLMGDPTKRSDRTENFLLAQENKRQKDQYAVYQIDKALELYRQETEESGNDEFARRYRILRRYYIDENSISAEDLAELENVSTKTVYRDLNSACMIMYQYVIGM